MSAPDISSLKPEELKRKLEDGYIRRDRVCAMEIWCECLENQARTMKNIDARSINTIMQHMPGWRAYAGGKRGKMKFKLYGVQRAYYRKYTLSAQLYEAAAERAQKEQVANIDDLM